jgi:hypothetical protein
LRRRARRAQKKREKRLSEQVRRIGARAARALLYDAARGLPMTLNLRPGFGRLAPVALAFALAAALGCGGSGPPGPGPSDGRTKGQTEFTSVEQPGGPRGGGVDNAGGPGTAPGSVTGQPAPTTPGAPMGRVADVQEADIYKLSGTRLFYFNTYRGFIVYDIADAAKPVQLSRLPVYGYPVEMFVEGNVVYALLRDALYLSETNGKLQFQRHNVSQLVTIDVSDVAHPRVLKTLDIIGELHEGVSRKIDSTIYVVSEQFQGYYWGWQTPEDQPEEQAWVYSYDVSDPTNPKQVGQLPVFQGGGGVTTDAKGNVTSQRYFSGVSISATSNALMVVENWYVNDYAGTDANRCYANGQRSVVSVIDVSDPTGVIRRHTRFETGGSLGDQFKMTYKFDEASQKGFFFGIFYDWSWDCTGGSKQMNRLESWDITDGANPQRLASLEFGNANESVRGSAYDLSRNVVYAITARQIDPLYAIDIANPAAPRIRSQIDGLSGSISVFRSVAGGQFLLGVGQDTSTTCTGQQNGEAWLNTKMAISIIDVRDLSNIRLAQRGCVAIQNSGGWSWSSVTWNMDQAHKMLGMFQDGDLNIVTVPVSYYTQDSAEVGWWYHWKTAVGIMTWDLSRYDATKPPEQQSVIQSYGTFVHPEGEVMRSILFKHPVSGERTMINVSDTHLSVANIADLAQPQLKSIVEVAPSVDEIYGFGNYVVERVSQGQYWSTTGAAEFRVKQAGGPVDDKPIVATFKVGQATSAYRYQNSLVVLRTIINQDGTTGTTTSSNEAVVYDMSDPSHPRLASRLEVPFQGYRYYGYICGDFWGGYWFGGGQQTLVTGAGLAQVSYAYRNEGNKYYAVPTLSFLDLRDVNAPRVGQLELPYDQQNYWGWNALVADPGSATGFYLARRDYLGEVKKGDASFSQFKYFAQRFEVDANGAPVSKQAINLPGPLAQTWIDGGGVRRFLTSDYSYRTITFPDHTEWHADTRLGLLRQTGLGIATLLDTRTFADANVGSFVLDGDHLYIAAQNQYYWWNYAAERAANPPTWESTSDRLIALDVGGDDFTALYDQPTRTYGVQLMGMHQGKLFVSLPNDGLLAANVSDPAHPQALSFLRTLGWASHLEFNGNDAYVAAGAFGVFDLNLAAPAVIAIDR